MPSTRARTSATRYALVRPGSSVISGTAVGSTVTTPTLLLQGRRDFLFDIDQALALNPKLVIVRVSGWGQDGPYSQRPGFGTLIEGMSGFASMNGFADREPVLPPMYLADSVEEGIAGVRPYHDERYKWFAPFGFVRYADEQGRPWGTPGAPTGVPTIEEGVRQKAWLVGPPTQVIARLRDLEAGYPGLEHIILHWPEGMPAHEWKDQLGLFAREVMPAFQPVGAVSR